MYGGVDPNYTFQMGGGHLMSPNHCHLDARCRRPLAEGPAEGNGCFSLGRNFWSKEGMFLAMQTTCWNPNSKYGFRLSKKPYNPCMVCFVYWCFRCDGNHPELIWWQQHVWAVCQRTGDDAGPWEAIEKRHWASCMLSCLTTGLQGHWGWSTVLLLWLNLPFTTYTASNLNFPRSLIVDSWSVLLTKASFDVPLSTCFTKRFKNVYIYLNPPRVWNLLHLSTQNQLFWGWDLIWRVDRYIYIYMRFLYQRSRDATCTRT